MLPPAPLLGGLAVALARRAGVAAPMHVQGALFWFSLYTWFVKAAVADAAQVTRKVCLRSGRPWRDRRRRVSAPSRADPPLIV